MTDIERDKYYASLLQRMVRFDTVSVPGAHDPEKFRPFQEELPKLFPHLFHDLSIGLQEGTLLMLWHGKQHDRPVLLMSHHDTAPADGKWSHPPFTGDIADGRLYGRGTLDCKGNLMAMLQAAEELCIDGFQPEQDIWFESSCTEETDGSGASGIAEQLKKQGIRFSLILDEGGFILHDPLGAAEHDFALVGVGEKGSAELRFTARSEGGSSAVPPKDTPLVRLGRFMLEAEQTALFELTSDETLSELLRRYAEYMRGPRRLLFSKAGGNQTLLTRLLTRLLTPAAAAMLQSTLAFTMAQGSDQSTVLPREAWVIGNLRYSHHQGLEGSVAAVRALAEKYEIEVTVSDPGVSSGISDYHSDGFRLVEAAVAAAYPDTTVLPCVLTDSHDCRFFSDLSDCCFRFSPFRISDIQLHSIRDVDEHIGIEGLHRAVDFYRHVISEGPHNR